MMVVMDSGCLEIFLGSLKLKGPLEMGVVGGGFPVNGLGTGLVGLVIFFLLRLHDVGELSSIKRGLVLLLARRVGPEEKLTFLGLGTLVLKFG